MAQDIIIAGAQYPEVSAINIPKTAGGTALFVDTSEDTITAEKLLNGITAHDKNGENITGTLPEVVQATPIVGVDAMGKVTAYASQKAGMVVAGTKSATMQLPTQEPIEIIPSSSRQTAVEKGIFTTGFVTVAAVFAVIGVTYPAGSTCTCTNGETTLTADDTSGKAMFIIPEAGTWTVKAVSGNKSVSKAVSITVAGQVETVTLIYELYIFNKGKVSGIDWEVVEFKNGYASASIGSTITGSTNGGGEVYQGWSVSSTTKIDVSRYTKLCANVTMVTPNDLFLGIDTSKKVEAGYSDLQAYSIITQTGKVSVDISSINTSCYIGLGRNWWKMSASQLTVDQIWLE